MTGESFRERVLAAVIFGLFALSACATVTQETVARAVQKPTVETIVIPPGARELKRSIGDGTVAVLAEALINYPAESYLCEVTLKLRAAGWRPVRESAFNLGLPSGFVRGWWDFTDATKQPEEHVHGWMTEWLGLDGEFAVQALEYRYREGAPPVFDRIRIAFLYADQSMARMWNGGRYGELFQLTTDAAPAISESRSANCAAPQ